MPLTDEPLLVVDDLRVQFRRRRGVVHAVDGVSFEIGVGETLGLVGESGSGKTTIGRAILGLAPVHSGRIELKGNDITHASRRERRNIAHDLQAIFQDPYSSLNPALRVGASVLESAPSGQTQDQARERMEHLLVRVGLPASAAMQYPAEFSGGQRQRLAVARALMASPSLVVCDEPVSALDVSVQAQVINLLRDIQRDFGLSYLFVGHDLDVVRFMSDRIVVLYHGCVLEEGPADIVARAPRSPYTQALVAATPKTQLEVGAGSVSVTAPAVLANSASRDTGCPFAHRCPLVIDICRSAMPPLVDASGGGKVACHRYPESVGGPESDTPRVAGRLSVTQG